ncbi:unnamed protein product [Rangifer tarandus platyrhynchus]|uniref:Uncharacterized protein n=1 Tax=Rangifer tarandus platyrhynchus TaxID=3082113 RepID=A0ABN8YHD4_RANTA|nr:unnamed protein product [Rangifer tarandus platyrhynchus]
MCRPEAGSRPRRAARVPFGCPLHAALAVHAAASCPHLSRVPCAPLNPSLPLQAGFAAPAVRGGSGPGFSGRGSSFQVILGWGAGAAHAYRGLRGYPLAVCHQEAWSLCSSHLGHPWSCGRKGRAGIGKAGPACCAAQRPSPPSEETPALGLSALLTLCIPFSPQGIERLQRKNQRRQRRGSWKSVKETFGGAFSLHWFNPFSGPSHPKPLSDRDWVRQVSSVSDTENTETTTEEPSEERKDLDSAEVVDDYCTWLGRKD